MSRISTDEVARVAGLAHIALTDEEITRFAGELDAIADAVSKVSEAPAAQDGMFLVPQILGEE